MAFLRGANKTEINLISDLLVIIAFLRKAREKQLSKTYTDFCFDASKASFEIQFSTRVIYKSNEHFKAKRTLVSKPF